MTSTALEVDETVVNATTECTKNLRCLVSSRSELCQVKHCVQGKVHFIECERIEYCSYQMSFGTGFVCNCPVRKYIYNSYGF